MGLDGIFRKSPPATYGINAAKGRWLNEHTFALEHRILGHGETQIWTLTFDGKKVNVDFENTDGFKSRTARRNERLNATRITAVKP